MVMAFSLHAGLLTHVLTDKCQCYCANAVNITSFQAMVPLIEMS